MKQTVFITGATGSIGRALAIRFAMANYNLVLHGRSEQKLLPLVEHCRSLGVEVSTCLLDLTDMIQVSKITSELLAESVPDVFIANAGININHGRDNSGENIEAIANLVDVNIKSTLIMTSLVAKAMRNRGHGQIGLVSSLAAHFGLPVTPSYSASKSAVKAYGEGLRGWLAPAGVGVTVIMPGYIESEMCDEMPGPKPFLLKASQAAEVIFYGLQRNKARVSFPLPLNLGTWFLGILPAPISLWILKQLNYSHG